MARRTSRSVLESLYRAALDAADPETAVERALASPAVRAALSPARKIGVFAVGKAAAGMARAALRGTDSLESLVVLPAGHPARGLSRRAVVFAAHPVPDASSTRAARRALRFFRRFGDGDVVVCLVSGGTSSLLALPRPGVTLSRKRRAVGDLARSGAPIAALNRLRTALSAVKGGRLGRATKARLVTLVLSDVPGDRAALVGSGPTVRGRRGDLVRVVGSNRLGIDAAASDGRRLGFAVERVRRPVAGEARTAGARLAGLARRAVPGTLLVAGGEATVDLSDARSGARGGRCLELALSAARELSGDRSVHLLAAGSDGSDGSSGAAGAFADGSTFARALRRGLAPARALERHDTRAVFASLGDLFETGPTGTNVGDWVFLIRR